MCVGRGRERRRRRLRRGHMRRMCNFVSLIRKPLQANFILKSRPFIELATCCLHPALPLLDGGIPQTPPPSTIFCHKSRVVCTPTAQSPPIVYSSSITASQHRSSCWPCALELPSPACLCIHLAGDVFVWPFFFQLRSRPASQTLKKNV